MKDVADLLALAAESSVSKRPFEVMAGDPKRNHSLVNLAHLPRTGDDAAAVDQSAHTVAEDILLDQLLAG